MEEGGDPDLNRDGAIDEADSLKAEILSDNKVALTISLPLSVSPVEEFYWWVNLRSVCGDSSPSPPS